MKPDVSVKETDMQISKVSVNSTGLSFLYTIKISKAYLSDEQAVNVIYPNGDDLYSIGNVSKKIETLFERPAQVSADGTINMNPTATDPELLEQQTLELQDICEELKVFTKTFKPKEFSTSNYEQDKGGISIYTDNLYNGSLLKKDKDFQKLVSDIIYLMTERGLINTMNNISSKKKVRLSAKESAGKIKKILDSLFPACDLELRFPEKSIMESSSKVGMALSRVEKHKLNKTAAFQWEVIEDGDTVKLFGSLKEDPEQVVIFSYDTNTSEISEETYYAYNSAPEEGEAITGFKSILDVIDSVTEWQALENNEHVQLDDYSVPPQEMIDEFRATIQNLKRRK